MPECIKSSEHSNYCNPSNNNCSYISESNKEYKDPKQLIEFLFHNQNEIYLTLQNSNNAKLLLLFLMQSSQKFSKFYRQCLKLLNKFNKLSSKKLFKIYKAGCALLNIASLEKGTGTAYISNIASTTLPFTKGFCQSRNISKKQYTQVPITRFLIDSGSDCNILSFKDFNKFNLSKRELKNCGIFNLKGSTGTVENCFQGIIKLKLYLQAADTKYYHQYIDFYVTKESLELPSILGINFLEKTGSSLLFANDRQINCSMFDKSNKICKVHLQQIHSVSSHLVNTHPVTPESEVVSFHLKNNMHYFGETQILSTELSLPLVDLSCLEQVFCYKNEAIKISEEEINLDIPLLKPVNKIYEKGELKATLENYYFMGHDCINKLFGSNGQKENVPQIPNYLYDLPNRPATREVIKSEELPSSAKGQQTSSGGPAEVFYTEPATNYLPSTEDTQASNIPTQNDNPAQDSLSQEISRSFKQEFLEIDQDTQAIFSFLAEKKIA